MTAEANQPTMSEEQLKAFLEKVKGDSKSQEKLKAAADVDTVVSIARATGFIISVDEIENAQSGSPQLSEKELENVEGGQCWCPPGNDGAALTNIFTTHVISKIFDCDGSN